MNKDNEVKDRARQHLIDELESDIMIEIKKF